MVVPILAYLFWALLCLKWIQKNVVDKTLGLIFGYSTREGWHSDRWRKATKYESCAQVVKIWLRAHYSPATIHSPVNFLYTHQEYVHPQEVLAKDNITLQGVTASHAWFCVSLPDIDVYDPTVVPFVWVGQFVVAKQLIIMPLWAFYKLADELGDPRPDDKEVFIISNTARCGSTLLCQMLNKLPNTRAMSEPYSMCLAHTLYNTGKISNEDGDYSRLIRSILHVECKDESRRDVKRLFIKLPVWCSPQVPIMCKACPYIKHFFNTRHPKPSVVSFFKMATGPILTSSVKYELQKLSKCLLPLPYHDPDGFYAQFRQELLADTASRSLEELAALACGVALLCYAQDRERYVCTVIYEDLVKDPAGTTAKLFKILGIPNNLVPLALTAMEKDSQKKFFGNTDGSDYHAIGTDKWEKIDRLFARLKIPISNNMTYEQFQQLFQYE